MSSLSLDSTFTEPFKNSARLNASRNIRVARTWSPRLIRVPSGAYIVVASLAVRIKSQVGELKVPELIFSCNRVVNERTLSYSVGVRSSGLSWIQGKRRATV